MMLGPNEAKKIIALTKVLLRELERGEVDGDYVVLGITSEIRDVIYAARRGAQ